VEWSGVDGVERVKWGGDEVEWSGVDALEWMERSGVE